MNLLHATWLTAFADLSDGPSTVLFLWADTWQVATPKEPKNSPCTHPYTLSTKELEIWLKK